MDPVAPDAEPGADTEGRQNDDSRCVFLNYTQEQLDKAYDQSAWVPQMAQLEAADGERSAAVRRKMPPRTEQYGHGPADLLDVFAPAGARGAPILVFLHGGAWLRNTREDVSHPAPILVERGAIYIAPDYASLKTARLPDLAENCRRAVAWAAHNAAGLGGDPDRVFVAGHSAGAHLAACALTTDWTARGERADLIKGAMLLSGMYDLYPVLLSSRRSYVKITAEEAAALSPIRHLRRVVCPVAIVSADQDSPEFKRQSAVFAAALAGMGRLNSRTELFNTNHFQEIEQLGDASGSVSRVLFSLMGL
jgi:arylformamidase